MIFPVLVMQKIILHRKQTSVGSCKRLAPKCTKQQKETAVHRYGQASRVCLYSNSDKNQNFHFNIFLLFLLPPVVFTFINACVSYYGNEHEFSISKESYLDVSPYNLNLISWNLIWSCLFSVRPHLKCTLPCIRAEMSVNFLFLSRGLGAIAKLI